MTELHHAALDTRGYVAPARLAEIASFGAAVKARALSLLRLAPGMHVVDVGCGPGTDLPTLSAFVGPRGRIVALDHDPRMLDAARARDAARDGVDYLCADAADLPLATASFDGCHCDRVLQHVEAPAAVMREVRRILKPGGRCVALDTDWGSLSIDCPDTALERHIVGRVAEHFASGYIGRQLVRCFATQGLDVDHVEVLPIVWRSFALFRRTSFPAARVEAALIATGRLRRADWERFAEMLEHADDAGTFFASASVTLVGGSAT